MTETLSPMVLPRGVAPRVTDFAGFPTNPEAPATTAPWTPGRTILNVAIAVPLVALVVLLMTFSLVPAVFVALLLLLPALAPFILVALGFLATSGLKMPEHRICAPNEPCCCGLHDDVGARF